jgi:hypothetical protein
MSKSRRPIPKELQLSIFRRDRWICRWCNRPVIFGPSLRLLEREVRKAGRTEPLAYFRAHATRDGAPLLDELWGVIDHAEAFSSGGANSEENLVTACTTSATGGRAPPPCLNGARASCVNRSRESTESRNTGMDYPAYSWFSRNAMRSDLARPIRDGSRF